MDNYDIKMDTKPKKFSVWQVFNKHDLEDSKDALPKFVIDDNEEMVITKQNQVINELQKKIEELTNNVQYFENMSNSKDRAIVALARDKERFVTEIKKERRVSSKLKRQLEDERDFYMQEKKIYCQEMNEYKKHKRKLLINNQFKEDNNQLRSKLKEVLQTNYNLCIKFLRMKHTKDNLKKQFDLYQNEQAKILKDLSVKLDNARIELDLIISEQFQNPISLNHKKILEIVKRNSHLINENLSLKLEIEQINYKVDRLKNKQLKLKYQKLQINSKQNNRKTSSCENLFVTQSNEIDAQIKFDEISLMRSSTKSSEIYSSKRLFFDPSTIYSSGLRTQSEPALIDFDTIFRQLKSTATQTN